MEKKKLLVVVDMQNDFVTGVLGTKEAQAIVEPMAEYIKNFDGDVIFTQDTHHKNYLDTQEGKKLPVSHCIKGTEGWKIVPELDSPFNLTIEKETFGSVRMCQNFLDSTIHYYQGNLSEVQFCGVCTGICVISNVLMLKAFCPEIPIKVIERLCACVTPETHKIAIEAMRTCQVDII
jgi:nicotinamidase-related amidase